MNTVVWIMVTFGHTSISLVTGPEFKDQQRCERAATAIWLGANERTEGYRPGREYVRRPFCVRIEK